MLQLDQASRYLTECQRLAPLTQLTQIAARETVASIASVASIPAKAVTRKPLLQLSKFEVVELNIRTGSGGRIALIKQSEQLLYCVIVY